MRTLKIANSRAYNIKMTYYLVTIQTIVCLTGVIFQIPKWRVPRLLKSEELSLTGQGLLRFIELKTFRSVTGYSISIVNMSKQDDGSITGEILHRLDYPSVYAPINVKPQGGGHMWAFDFSDKFSIKSPTVGQKNLINCNQKAPRGALEIIILSGN